MPNRTIRSVALCVALSLGVVACGDEIGLPADADPQLLQGLDVYRARCARCHGPTGGGGIGPNIQEVEAKLDDEQQRTVVVDGRNNMPRFGSTLSEADIDAVVRFTREIL
ncbi:MAG: c-type cytochrome [Acidimicrobiales bacterium]